MGHRLKTTGLKHSLCGWFPRARGYTSCWTGGGIIYNYRMRTHAHTHIHAHTVCLNLGASFWAHKPKLERFWCCWKPTKLLRYTSEVRGQNICQHKQKPENSGGLDDFTGQSWRGKNPGGAGGGHLERETKWWFSDLHYSMLCALAVIKNSLTLVQKVPF